MEATKLFISNVEFAAIAIYSLRSWNNSLVGDHVSQSKPTIAQIVFSVMHRVQVASQRVCVFVKCTHAEEKRIASF